MRDPDASIWVKPQKAVIIALGIVAGVFWVYSLYLDSYYFENAPRQPIAAEGRIYPEVVHHGAHIFLTKREQFNLKVVAPSMSIGAILIAGLLSLRWKLFGFTKDYKGVDLFYSFRKKKGM